MNSMEWRARLLSIFLADKTALNITLAFTSAMATIGLIIGTPKPSNYIVFLSTAGTTVWACLFALHSFLSIGCIIFEPRVLPNILRSALGMWLWSYAFISFIVLAPAPIAPMELIIISFLLAEFWVLTSNLVWKGFNDDYRDSLRN